MALFTITLRQLIKNSLINFSSLSPYNRARPKFAWTSDIHDQKTNNIIELIATDDMQRTVDCKPLQSRQSLIGKVKDQRDSKM